MKIVIVFALAAMLAGCSASAGQNRSLFGCITVTEKDAEVISDHLTNQIVAQNEFLRC